MSVGSLRSFRLVTRSVRKGASALARCGHLKLLADLLELVSYVIRLFAIECPTTSIISLVQRKDAPAEQGMVPSDHIVPIVVPLKCFGGLGGLEEPGLLLPTHNVHELGREVARLPPTGRGERERWRRCTRASGSTWMLPPGVSG